MIKRNRHGHNPWRLLHHAEGSIPCGYPRLYAAKPSCARCPRRAVGGFRQLVRRCAVVPSAGVQTRRTPGISSQGPLACLRLLLHPEPAAHQRAHPTAGGRPRVPRPLRVRRAAPAPHHLQPLHPAPFHHADLVEATFADLTHQLKALIPGLGRQVAVDATTVRAIATPTGSASVTPRRPGRPRTAPGPRRGVKSGTTATRPIWWPTPTTVCP